ncbi:MAG: hypothetical protein FJ320_03515 [SAR202 cluster bacterium]|nr:hypothetical protein [SAR202 cluster bacterium]
MQTSRYSQARRLLRTIRQNLDRLEAILKEPSGLPIAKPTDPSTQLLEQIYGIGVIEQRALFKMLDDLQLSHNWIGSQISAGYLDMWASATGNLFYRVTQKAIRELALGRLLPLDD